MAAQYEYNSVVWKSDNAGNRIALREMLGLLPLFLMASDDRGAIAQFGNRYIGGWNSFKGFKYNKDTHELQYSDDPPMKPIASATLRDELILLYPRAWVAVVQPDGAIDIGRFD